MSDDASLQVEGLSNVLPNDRLWGSFRVKGVAGSRLELIGWVLGIAEEVSKVEIVSEGAVIAATEPSLPRNEIAEQFPERKSAATCGFELTIEAQGRGKSRLELRAALEDGGEAPMGEVRVSTPGRRWAGIFRRG